MPGLLRHECSSWSLPLMHFGVACSARSLIVQAVLAVLNSERMPIDVKTISAVLKKDYSDWLLVARRPFHKGYLV